MKKPDSLQVVRSLRMRHQDAAERSLTEALAKLQHARQAAAVLEQDLEHAKSMPSAQVGELLRIADLQERVHRIKQLEASLERARQSLAEATAAVAAQQHAYLDARRAREVVDELLKQRAAIAQQKQDRRDTKVSEDLFLGRSLRNSVALQQNETV